MKRTRPGRPGYLEGLNTMNMTRHLHFSLLLLIVIFLFLNTSCSKCSDPSHLRLNNSTHDLAVIYNQTDVLPKRPLTLNDVIAIVLTNNLDIKVQEYERRAQCDLAHAEAMKMLPPLTIDLLLSERSKNTASLTKILNSATQPTQEQLASLRETRQYDIRDTMNFIDLGMAYFKSRQEKTKALILDTQHLRAKQKLIMDTVEAYWKATTAQKMLKESMSLMSRTGEYHQAIEKQMELRNISEIQGLQTEARLYDAELQIRIVEYQLQAAKADLAGFMGVPPETAYELAEIELDVEKIELPEVTILEEQAILSRPDLLQRDLEGKVAVEAAHSAILQMMPNTAIFGDYNVDLNPFLLYRFWYSAGIKATWNLFNLPEQYFYMRSARDQEEQAYRARLALSVAVMTQVNIAYFAYRDSLDGYKLANKSFEARERLARAAQIEMMSGEFNGADVLNYVADSIVSKIIALKAYANLQTTIEQLNYAIGIPLLYGTADPALFGICYEADEELNENFPVEVDGDE